MRFIPPLLFLALATFGASYALRRSFPEAYSGWIRRALWAGGALAVLSLGAWRLGRALDLTWLWQGGATLTAILFVVIIALFLTAPVFGLLAALARPAPKAPLPGRRAFLRRAAGGVPLSAVAVGPAGAVQASTRPVLRPVEIRSASVPAGLDGIKILQLTDVHLGVFMDTAQIRAVVEAAGAFAPDLVVLTGDIADELSMLPEAIALLHELRPALGIHACIGNHEIYRGRAEAERHLIEGGVHYHCGSGMLLHHQGAPLWVCGADDPARLGREHRPFLAETVGAALAGCPPEVSCRIVLSHRPEGFEAAAGLGATLTLSGHTHGAQMALFGRSLFEWLLPNNYLLGVYRRGESALYTSAGLGHWFPFRLNCPCEAACVTLRAG